MQDKGVLLIISGPSGAGKGTVVEKLIKNGDYILSISATTRKPRNYEKEGEHYYFKEKNEFVEMIETGGFIEHACFCDNYYGTPKKKVEKKLAEGMNVILEIEVQGALQVKEKMSDAVLVFLIPPSIKELRNRLKGRNTESDEVIDSRIKRAVEEIELLSEYDYIVVNDEVNKAANKIDSIVKVEKMRPFRNLETIKKLGGEI